ncbi:LOW QUALITY PROTEIN: astacin-like metalloendopeptidase [Salvelinus fontinalis]|uniref:LOW QUALITY PROTEIN: astacin-like metalloendopeptidase n=1 Tax=Salvelinus fontinalis TaxID=8038 RepID=UPI002485922F|nr:LOW QUALITY PROTEIN: astacin-like metalloendopeptidase [Salvelinus fontinalis]
MARKLCHELLHTLGLHHKHTRLDRDRYVTIQWESVVPGKEKNFQVKKGDPQNLPYDYNSIMQYGPNFFSADWNPTIVPKKSGVHMGQRTDLRSLNITRLN